MTKVNCRSVRREIEEAEIDELLTSVAHDHLKHCRECETFREGRTKLREIVASLGTVDAPGDFEFRLRARLAGEKGRTSRAFAIGDLSFNFRAAAFATVVVAIGAAFLLVDLKSGSITNLTAGGNQQDLRQTQETAATERGNVGAHALTSPEDLVKPSAIANAGIEARSQRGGSDVKRPRLSQVAKAQNRNQIATDLSSTQAEVLRREDLANGASVFPIAASSQSLRVSVDNGRGSSRTISLPTVSFGSQRSVSQNLSGLMASSRGSW